MRTEQIIKDSCTYRDNVGTITTDYDIRLQFQQLWHLIFELAQNVQRIEEERKEESK